jgi:hypothetical protein
VRSDERSCHQAADRRATVGNSALRQQPSPVQGDKTAFQSRQRFTLAPSAPLNRYAAPARASGSNYPAPAPAPAPVHPQTPQQPQSPDVRLSPSFLPPTRDATAYSLSRCGSPSPRTARVGKCLLPWRIVARARAPHPRGAKSLLRCFDPECSRRRSAALRKSSPKTWPVVSRETTPYPQLVTRSRAHPLTGLMRSSFNA